VQVHGRSTDAATAPTRVAINLGNVEVRDVARGVTLASPGSIAVTARVDLAIELLPGARALRHGGRVRLHHGTSEVLGRVSIAATRGADDAGWRQAHAGELGVSVPPGGRAFVRLRLERPAVLTRTDRVVLRAYSPPVTIGGGSVLDPEPAASGARRAGALDRFLALANPEEALRVFLRDAGPRGLQPADFMRRAGLGPAETRTVIDRDVAAGRTVAAGGRIFAREDVERLEAAIEQTLAAFHAAHPIDAGMPREALRDQAAAPAPPALFDSLLARLQSRGLVRAGERVARADHRPTETSEDARVRDVVVAAVKAGGLTPPDAAALASAAGVPAARLQPILQRLVREKQLVKLDALIVHPGVLDRLKDEIRALAADPARHPVTVDVATFKERYGLTRRFAIPLLEWLDRERVTRRVGEKRVVI
jgi:selenocysteine-specific elongation factor